MEPAIEVLSVCLPIMAPFLHGRKFLRELRSSIASLLPFSSFSRLHGGAKKSADSLELEGKFHRIGNRRHHEVKIFDEEAPSEYRQPRFDGPRDAYAVTSAAAEGRRKARDGDLDDVPLHSIKVTDRVDVH